MVFIGILVAILGNSFKLCQEVYSVRESLGSSWSVFLANSKRIIFLAGIKFINKKVGDQP